MGIRYTKVLLSTDCETFFDGKASILVEHYV